MKFMLTFKTTPDRAKRDEAIQRFLKTGGQPPKVPSYWGVGRQRILAMDSICWRVTM